MILRKLKSLSVQEWHLQKWEYLGHSVQHRSLLSELCYPGADIKHVGNVRVIFSEKFKLGEGSNETRVYLGLTNDGNGKAVKQMRRDNYLQPAQHEKKILNEFNAKKSKYVVNYYFLEEDTGTDYVYLILDLCEESLEKFVKDSTLHYLQKALPDILRQILNGLADLHSGPDSILHRDLKPSNVLRDVDGKFLIADFGISRMLKNGCKTYKSNFNRGTEYWIAPESYCEDEDSNAARNEDPNEARYKKESDVYNAGMVAYYVATKGKHPFGTKRFRLDNMLNGKPVGLDEIKDETLKDLLSWMLKLQPEERPSANEALKHPFLLSDDEKFHFLCKVGDLLSIKRNDPQCSIAQQINIESSNWKSQMDDDVYEYLVNGRNYGSSLTECLRLIRSIGMHWNDRPRPLPQPEPYYKIGDYKAYFVKTFPSLPVWIHRAVSSNDELKDSPELSVIEKWDSTENNWRDQITVYDTDRHVKKDEPAKPNKTPKKRTGMLKRISKLFSPSDDHTADKDDHIYESIDHQDGINGSDKQSGPASQCSNYEIVNDHNYYQPVSNSQDDIATAHDRNHGQPVSTSNEGYATVDDHNYLQPASNLRERCVTVHDSIHIQAVPTSRNGYATVEEPHYIEPASDLKDGHATVNESENMQTVHFSNDSHVTRNDSSHLQPLPTSTEGYATLEDPRYSQPASDSRDDFVTVDGSDLIQPVTTSIDGGYAILEDPRYVQAQSNLKDRHATEDESTPMQPENNYEPNDGVYKMSARNPLYHRKESLQEKDKDESDEYASPTALGQYKTANDDENAIYQSPTSNKKLLNGRGSQVDNLEYMSKIDAQLF